MSQAIETIRPKGNAIVPTDLPALNVGSIAPPQAQAICTAQEVARAGATGAVLNWSSRNITYVPQLLISDFNGIMTNATGNGASINLSGNALINSAFIDAILRVLANAGSGQVSLDFSAGTNAAPTLPAFYIDFNSLSVNGTPSTYGTCTPGAQSIFFFDDGQTLNDGSAVDFSGGTTIFTVGVSDSPTKQQIITKLAALGSGTITDLTGLKIRVIPTDYLLEPIAFTDMTGSGLDPAFTLDFNYIELTDAHGDLGELFGAVGGTFAIIHFASGSALSASTLTWDGSATWASIGISDSPSKQAVINKLVAVSSGKVTDLGGLRIRAVPTNNALGEVACDDMPGSGFVANNYIGLIIANGGEVNTN